MVVAQFLDQLPGGSVPAAFGGGIAVVPQIAFRYVSNMFLRLKQCLQIAHQLVGGVPIGGDSQFLHFQPVGVYDPALGFGGRRVDDIVPIQGMPGGAAPAMVAGQFKDAVLGNGVGVAAEAAPFAGTFAPVVSATIAGTPLLPTCHRVPGLL